MDYVIKAGVKSYDFEYTEEYTEALRIFRRIKSGEMELPEFLRIMEDVYRRYCIASDGADKYSRMRYPDTTGQ